ncbi:MAG: hypothetical protein AAGG46_09115, partial [Planctomycetota bacterium]
MALRLAQPKAEPPPPPLAVIQGQAGHSGPVDNAGDVVLLNSLAELERRVSVEAELVQSGYVLGHPVELAGVYRQKGRADNRRFATLLRGRVA